VERHDVTGDAVGDHGHLERRMRICLEVLTVLQPLRLE